MHESILYKIYLARALFILKWLSETFLRRRKEWKALYLHLNSSHNKMRSFLEKFLRKSKDERERRKNKGKNRVSGEGDRWFDVVDWFHSLAHYSLRYFYLRFFTSTFRPCSV